MKRWTQTEDPGLLPAGDLFAQMSSLATAAMTFVAAIVLSLALAATRTAESWEASVAAGLTIEMAHETPPARQEAVVSAIADLPGVEAVGVMSLEERAALLSPWLGQDIDAGALRLPVLIEVAGEVEAEAARAAVTSVAPQAVVTDHLDWREPVLRAAARIRAIALAALGMAVVVASVVVWLAVSASVSAGGRVVEVLRLVGATDAFVVSRFARPFAVRAGLGSAAGAALALLALILLRLAGPVGPITPGPVGYEWAWLAVLPLVSAGLAWVAARLAVVRALKGVG